MTKQLYEEALADVKKLKEVAEDNAKRALLEAVTPRIRDLIENQLLGESMVGELESDPEDLLMDNPVVDAAGAPVGAVPSPGDSDLAAKSMSMPDDQGKVTLDLDSLRSGDEYELSTESAVALGLVINSGENLTFESKLRDLQNKVTRFSGASKLIKETRSFSGALSSLISEVEDTYSYLQNNLQDSPKKDSYESILENYYSTLKQLMEQKMKNKKTLSEADLTLKLTGLPDDVEDALENIGVDLITGEEGEEGGEEEGGDDLDLGGEEDSEEGGEEEGGDDLDLDFGSDEDSEEGSKEKMESRRLSDDTIVEIDEGMLRREISRMKALRETADMPKHAEKGHGPGDVSDEFAEDEMDPFAVKLTTEADKDEDEGEDEKSGGGKPPFRELDELDQAWSEGDAPTLELDEMELESSYTQSSKRHRDLDGHQAANLQPHVQKNLPESLRRRIAAEMKLQLEAKKKAGQAKSMYKSEKDKEKNAPPSNESKKRSRKNQSKLREAYNFYATKFNESVARTTRLKGMLAEATRKGAVLNDGAKKSAAETDLRNKLAETNLFNAKLLFTNKLLQNESLTKRQKAEVIERLDEAKNEREVKLVYESLVKTLTGTPSKITESADRGVIGSSSRPARPAAATNTLNEGFEADRWARLAGIVK